MATIEIPNRIYIVLRDYRKELEAVLRVPCPNLISDNDFIAIIKEWLFQEKVGYQTISFKNGDHNIRLSGGYEVVSEKFKKDVIQFKLYRYVTKYNVEEEEDLPF